VLLEAVAVGAKVSDIWNWTGKGQPPAPPAAEPLAAAAAVVADEVPSVAELSETSLTPETRRSCTMVSATVFWSCAQPVRATAEGVLAVAAVAEAVVAEVVGDADGAVA
jgi:hypothetical protein